MATTPTYGWPYQGLSDPPNGAILGENLALAIEATMQAREAEITATEVDIAALEALSPYRARQTLSGTAASVTFSSIPSTLRSLRVLWTARNDVAGTSNHIRMRINSDTGSSYNTQFIQGLVTAVSTANLGGTSAFVGELPGATAGADIYGSGVIDLVGWDRPHSQYLGFTFISQAITSGGITDNGGGVYINGALAAYTSLTLLPLSDNFVAGSDFQIIGERA